MATNEFLPFATGGGANVEAQATYAADPSTSVGFSSGTAQSAKFNKVFRQAAFMAAMIGQFISDELAADVLDDGNLAGKKTQFIAALQKAIPSEFASGTTVLFRMATAPAGWTQDVDLNDRVLRIVNDASGGNFGGDWALSGVVINGHTLTTAEMPNHNHVAAGNPGAGDPVINSQGNNWGNSNNYLLIGGGFSQSAPLNTSFTGGGAPHSHGVTADGTWRPAYVNIISATKD